MHPVVPPSLFTSPSDYPSTKKNVSPLNGAENPLSIVTKVINRNLLTSNLYSLTNMITDIKDGYAEKGSSDYPNENIDLFDFPWETLKTIQIITNFIKESYDQGSENSRLRPLINKTGEKIEVVDTEGNLTSFYFTRRENDLVLNQHKTNSEIESIGQNVIAISDYLRYEIEKGEESIDLECAELSEIKLPKADLSYAVLDGANLNKGDLHEVDFSYASLWNTNLAGANLSYTNMCFTSLFFTDFSGANLTGATLDQVSLKGVTIDSDTNFTEASISLLLPEAWTPETLDECLNHLNNDQTGSLLTIIESINNQYHTLKINLMHQIIDSLGEVDIDCVSNAFMHIFIGNPIYLDNEKIQQFINDELLPSIVNAANISALSDTYAPLCSSFLNVISKLAPKEQQGFMLAHNGFFIQFMMLSIKGTDSEIQQAQQLYHSYLTVLSDRKLLLELTNPELLNFNSQPDFFGTSVWDHMEINGCETNKLDLLIRGGSCFVFFKQSGQENYFLFLSKEQIKSMLTLQEGEHWSQVYWVQGEKAVQTDQQNLTTLFSLFPLFENAYRFVCKKATFQKLLGILNLQYKGDTNKDGQPSEYDYAATFIAALEEAKLSKSWKLCSNDDQVRLNSVFKKLFVPETVTTTRFRVPRQLIDKHYQDIIAVYELSTATTTVQAKTLFCLAALFAKYSSSYYFGTESDSPQALREYAGALLAKAYSLDAEIFSSEAATSKENYDNWLDKMLGRGKLSTSTETCTGILSGDLIKHSQKEEEFKMIVSSMMPPAWIV